MGAVRIRQVGFVKIAVPEVGTAQSGVMQHGILERSVLKFGSCQPGNGSGILLTPSCPTSEPLVIVRQFVDVFFVRKMIVNKLF